MACLLYLADKAINTCVGEYVLLSYFIKNERNLIIMNKVEFIKKITEVSAEEVTQKQVSAVLTAIESVVRNVLSENKDEKITLPGLGSFSVKHVAERSGVAALAGGKEWTKPAHDELKFTISKSVKTL